MCKVTSSLSFNLSNNCLLYVNRLRMAQEIQRQLEELEVKQRELEERGVTIEIALRGEGAGKYMFL